ncbi:uncharacterized protein [Mytilus edulis]|uniref:uncharacterized protein isoform X2 n=1 Tax=Mytilus edulis TaxID=6550 RepID=UPI0039EE0AA3
MVCEYSNNLRLFGNSLTILEMDLRIPLLLLTIAGIVYSAGIPSCVYPCAWRGDAIPILIERDGIWINNRPNGGTFTNTSLPNGQQTAPSACIIRHGPFFLGKEFGVFTCFKVIQISETEWYYYAGEVSVELKDFCTMCDGTRMVGPIYMTGNIHNYVSGILILGCVHIDINSVFY